MKIGFSLKTISRNWFVALLSGLIVLVGLVIFVVIAAEVNIDTALVDATDEFGGSPISVFTSTTTGYIFYVDDTGADVRYQKTTDGGTTWGGETDIADTGTNVAVWYDKWTPGDTGTKIHLVMVEESGDDLYYKSLDTSDDSLSPTGTTWTQIYNGSRYNPAQDGAPSITKATDGALWVLCYGKCDGSSDSMYIASSTDSGSTWADDSPTLAGGLDDNDFGQLLPLSGGDVLLINSDTTATNVISIEYDAATNAWTNELTIDSSWAKENNYDQPWGAALDINTGDIYLAGSNQVDNAANDLEAYKFSDSARTWSTLTNIVTNDGNVLQGTMVYDPCGMGTLYALYLRGTLADSMDVYYKYSTTSGSTWSAESAKLNNTTSDDFKNVRTNLMSSVSNTKGGIIYAAWYNDDLQDIVGAVATTTHCMEQSTYRFFNNTDTTDVGSALADENTAGVLVTDGQAFRLRSLLHHDGPTMSTNEHNYKLQFAEKSGTCDESYTGETYADVTDSTAIAFKDNTPSDGDALTSNGSDPTHDSDSIVNQDYEEANYFTNSEATIADSADGKWDWALYDNTAPDDTNYCFRVVNWDGSTIATSTNTKIPEIQINNRNVTISHGYNEVFDFQGPASTTATITVTDVGGGGVTAANDLRVVISTTTAPNVDMSWDTTDTTAIFGGTASSTEVTSATVSFEGSGSVMVVSVVDDFDAGETLTIGGLNFTDFNTATSSTASVIGLYLDGSGDSGALDATASETVAIRGTTTLANHTVGQVTDQWDTYAATTTVHYRYKLSAGGENMTLGTTTFALSSITGVANANITSAKLYEDTNNSGLVDTSDPAVAYLYPNAAGQEQDMTPCAANEWECVDEEPPDDATTVNFYELTIAGVIHENYNIQNSTTTGTITNVQVESRVWKDITGVCSWEGELYINGSYYVDGEAGTGCVSETWVNDTRDFATNPDDSEAWDWADIDSMIVGIKGNPLLAIGASMDLTSVRAEVTYTPGDIQIPNTSTPGKVSISGGTGYIEFATSTTYSINSGESKDYILELAMTGLEEADTMTIDLLGATTTGDTTSQSITHSGDADAITHTMDSSPTISNFTLNDGNDIVLSENTFKWVTTTMLVDDTELCSTIDSVTATAYLASTTNDGTTCTGDDQKCYIDTWYTSCVATTTGNTCGASPDTDEEYDCGFKMWYVAIPTDSTGWNSSIWSVAATATDTATLTGTATNSTEAIEVQTLLAFDITETEIDYGNIAPGQNTDTTNQTITLTNTGNSAFDPKLEGVDLVKDSSSIAVTYNLYSDAPFDYDLAGTALTTTATYLDLALATTTATTSAVTDLVYWGFGVPSGRPTGIYQGSTTLTAFEAI